MKGPIILFPFLVISSISLSQKTNVILGKASFQGLGDFPGGEFSSSAQSISADGKVIIGFGTTSSGEEAFRWTEETGIVSLGNLPDKSFKKSWANKISADGNVIVGYGDPVGQGWNTYKGFVWTSSEGMSEIGTLDTSSRSMAFCVSADGTVIAGDGGPAAFKWTKESQTKRMGVLPGRTHSRIIGMSANGKVMIGQSYSLPAWDDEDGFILTADGKMQSMSSLTGGKYCMVLCLSPDGSAIAGTTHTSSYPAFFWTKEKGMVTIGHLPERNTTHPGDMTPFGEIIVGGSYSGPDNGDAFIWDSIHGMSNLQTLLEKEYGLDLTGWKLQNASGITPDGNIIVGDGINPQGQKEGFRVILDTVMFFSASLYKSQKFNEIYGDYLGQTPPGDTPVVFARGIISDSYQQHGAPSFSPDGNMVFWQTNQRPANDNEKWLTFSMTMKRVGDNWTAPEISPYGSMPFFSPDGNRIYFAGKEDGDDPCYVEKQVNSWSEPKSIGLISRFPELKNVFFPSITNNGTIYFMGHAEGLWLNIGIYRAELTNGEYSKPELLPPGINAPGGMRNWAPFIAPDESYLIFCSTRGLPEYDQGDLHICFRQPDGSWTEPVNMGAPINTSEMERFSSLSPDGKYLFFTRDTPGFDEDVYWVSTGIIEKLRADIFKKK